MKYCWLLVLLGLTRAGHAQPATPYAQLLKLVSPPGAVFVQDSLWMDETEVANVHWLEYLHFLRKDSTEAQYRAALPDTTGWQRLGYNDPYLSYYLRYPGFRYYPVVGITRRQAAHYCRWRSAMVNENLHSAQYLRKHPKLRQMEFRVAYYLPTAPEWELAAGGSSGAAAPYGDVFPPLPGTKRYKQELVQQAAKLAIEEPACRPLQAAVQARKAIFRVPFTVREHLYCDDIQQAFTCLDAAAEQQPVKTTLADGDLVTESIYSNPPNPRGFYNMIGNVAELTATPGVAKGGSWRQSIRQCTVQANLPYTQPQAWLGFRCACTVYIELKK